MLINKIISMSMARNSMLFIFFCVVVFISTAQDVEKNKGFFLALHYSLTPVHFYERFVSPSGAFFLDNGSVPGWSLMTDMGAFIIPERLALGLSYGLDFKLRYGIRSTPLGFNGRYFLRKNPNSLFVTGQAGWLLPTGRFTHRGFYYSAGFGQKVFFTGKLAAILSVNYSLRRYSLTKSGFNNSESKLSTDGPELRLGLFF